MLTGTIINYFYHCKRQCWLFYHRVNLENNSEDVRIGKVLHEIKNNDQEEVKIDNISLDKITAEYVVEMKKSDADIEAAKAQLLFYLWCLKKKGIERKGRLEFIEKKKQDKKTHVVVLDQEEEERIKLLEDKVRTLLETPNPPEAKLLPHCKKCAYYEYCFI